MNVYDFDKTICKDDSEADFFKYMLFHRPINLIYIPYFINARIQYKRNKIDEKEYRHRTYLTIKGVKNLDKVINKFWKKRKKKIMSWYLGQQKNDDLIISATPRFLLEPILKELNIENYIVSEFDLSTRRFIGEINFGDMKASNFLKQYHRDSINEFYTDSLSDLPMIRLAKRAFIINKKGQVTPYQE